MGRGDLGVRTPVHNNAAYYQITLAIGRLLIFFQSVMAVRMQSGLWNFKSHCNIDCEPGPWNVTSYMTGTVNSVPLLKVAQSSVDFPCHCRWPDVWMILFKMCIFTQHAPNCTDLHLYFQKKIEWAPSDSLVVHPPSHFFRSSTVLVVMYVLWKQKFCRLALMCGLALCNQLTIIVYVLAISVWATFRLYHIKVLS